MRHLWVVLIVLVGLMLVVAPVSAQDGGEIVIQPEGLVYTIIGAIAGALAGAGALYYKLSGTKPADQLDENSRNGMLGLLLVGGWLASLTPGQWDDQQLEKIMAANGFQKPAWNNPHPPTPSPLRNEGESVPLEAFYTRTGSNGATQGLPFKGVPRNDPPPIDGLMYRDLTPLGDIFPDDEDVKG